jgi:glycosidase
MATHLRQVIMGTDGYEFDWNDSAQINYRMKAAWDLLVQEVAEWGRRGVDGVRLDR